MCIFYAEEIFLWGFSCLLNCLMEYLKVKSLDLNSYFLGPELEQNIT